MHRRGTFPPRFSTWLTRKIEVVEHPVVPRSPIDEDYRLTAPSLQHLLNEQQRVEVRSSGRRLNVADPNVSTSAAAQTETSVSSTFSFVSSTAIVEWWSGSGSKRCATR